MLIETPDQEEFLPDMIIKKIDHADREELQPFLDQFKDFFMLCEGGKSFCHRPITSLSF